MTALALAGAGGGSVAPDLVLPPGFDRLGEVVRFEQDSGPAVSEATREPRVATSPHLDPAPAGEGQEPALSLEDQLATLRPETAARVRRYLASRGSARDFSAAEGIHEQNLAHQLDRLCRHGGALAEAIAGRKDGVRGADLVPCTRCGLRGHVAGDPDRCLYYRGSLGMGGQASWVVRGSS